MDRFPNTQKMLSGYGLGDNDFSPKLEVEYDFGLDFKPILLDLGSDSESDEVELPTPEV